MKKFLAILLCATIMTFNFGAMTIHGLAIEGDWITRRALDDYDDPDDYIPAPGYQYTDEGFSTISADFSNMAPWYTVESKEAINMKDGFSMEIRIDQFSYTKNGASADHWISFSLYDKAGVKPGSDAFGSGWESLIRGDGDGSASVFSTWTTQRDEDGKGGSRVDVGSAVGINPEVDEDGKEHYTLSVTWDGENYMVSICGVLMSQMPELSDKMKQASPNGDFYVGITMYTSVSGGVADLTILDVNGDTPMGDDQKAPEENIKVCAPIADSATIPANQPALLWDATNSTTNKDPESADFEITPKGDNSYHLVVTKTGGYFNWFIKNSLSYEANDFSTVAILLRDFPGVTGDLHYGAGDVFTADGKSYVNWDLTDEINQFYGDNMEYTLILVDLSEVEGWEGRINFLRLGFDNMFVGEAWDVMWMGIFRSPQEANVYTEDFLGKETVTKEPESAPEETNAPVSTETEEAPTESEPEEITSEKATIVNDEKKNDGGCASVMGSATVVLVSLAAACVLKKKFE